MSVERKEPVTGKRFVPPSNGAIPDFKVQRTKNWVMSKQAKLGERRSNVDTPEKLPQPTISHRSLLVCDQLPSTPFLSLSL